MPAAVLTADEARKAAIEVIEDGRGRQAVHDLVTALRANRRTGTACTKTRAEVSGNNKKIYRQKGTGGARHGAHRQRAVPQVHAQVAGAPQGGKVAHLVGRQSRQ